MAVIFLASAVKISSSHLEQSQALRRYAVVAAAPAHGGEEGVVGEIIEVEAAGNRRMYSVSSADGVPRISPRARR